MEHRQEATVFWIVLVALLLLTRLVSAAHFLSIDNVNLAFSLEYFDPLNHQPQPPGYPFFVLFGRLLNFAFHSVEYTFRFTSLLVTGLCLFLTVALGTRLFSAWTGRAAAVLLLVNPVFWQTGADSPLRPFLALFSLLVAYCAWRCWNGEGRFALWGAVALGVGSGFRPELLPYLFLLWLISAWMGTRSIRYVLLGTAIVAIVVVIWIGGLVVAAGGIAPLTKLTLDYLVNQSSAESLLMGADIRAWMRQVSRLIVWNGLATIWWIWALPIFMFVRKKSGLHLDRRTLIFICAWLTPGLIQSAVIHVAAPGHTLFSIPALCLLGCYILSVSGRQCATVASSIFNVRETVFAAALVFNVMTFLNAFPLPEAQAGNGRDPSIKNAVSFATMETSLDQVRSMDQVAFRTLKEIREQTPKDRPFITVTTDIHFEQWIMNWRILRYYEGKRDIWVLGDQSSPPTSLLIRRYQSIRSETGSPTIPVPAGGRILWVLDRTSPFYKELASSHEIGGGQYVFSMDLSADAASFVVRGFKFAPTSVRNSESVYASSRQGVSAR